MASSILEFEASVKDYKGQLEKVYASLQTNPNNEELLTLKQELENGIAELEVAIAETEAANSLANATAPAPSLKPKPKWSVDDHPAYQPGYRKPGTSSDPADGNLAVSFAVNDTVLAKWVSGDKGYYPAKITSITGSSADPVYGVTFKNYDTTDTLRGSDIKVLPSENKKRKADGLPATPIMPTRSANSSVISAAANIDPELASQARKEPSKVSDGPVRPQRLPKKLKNTKDMEAGKNKWQQFQAQGKMGKAATKSSMFRTGEGVTARVGFTGSGQGMRKDPTRVRNTYKETEDDA